MIVRKLSSFVASMMFVQVAMLGCGEKDKNKTKITPADTKQSTYFQAIKNQHSEKVLHLVGSKINSIKDSSDLLKLETRNTNGGHATLADKLVKRMDQIGKKETQVLDMATESRSVWLSPICNNKEFASNLSNVLSSLKERQLIESAQRDSKSMDTEKSEKGEKGETKDNENQTEGSEGLSLKDIKIIQPGVFNYNDQNQADLIVAAAVFCGELSQDLEGEKEVNEDLKLLRDIFSEAREITIFTETLYFINADIQIQSVETKNKRSVALYSSHLELFGKNSLTLGSEGNRNPILYLGVRSSITDRIQDSELLIRFLGETSKVQKSSKRNAR